MDCIGLDGGYPQHIPKLLEKEDTLDIRNFCFPIRKRNGKPLDEDEATFNTLFGGFRSMVENTFGELDPPLPSSTIKTPSVPPTRGRLT